MTCQRGGQGAWRLCSMHARAQFQAMAAGSDCWHGVGVVAASQGTDMPTAHALSATLYTPVTACRTISPRSCPRGARVHPPSPPSPPSPLRYIADISKGLLIIIVGGVVGGCLMSGLWMIVLRWFAGWFVWLTLVGVNVALLAVTLYSFSLAGLLGDNEFASVRWWWW